MGGKPMVRTISSKSGTPLVRTSSSKSGTALVRTSSTKSATANRDKKKSNRSYLRTSSSKSVAVSRDSRIFFFQDDDDLSSESNLSTPNTLVESFSSPARLGRSNELKSGTKRSDMRNNTGRTAQSPARLGRSRSKDSKIHKDDLSIQEKKKLDFGRSSSFDSSFARSSKPVKQNDLYLRQPSKSPARFQNISRSLSGRSQSPFFRRPPGSVSTNSSKKIGSTTKKALYSSKIVINQSKRPGSSIKGLVPKKLEKNQKLFTARNRTSSSRVQSSEPKQLLHNN